MWRGFGVMSIFLLLPLSLLVQADEHPLPLLADFDPAECASCHSDKQEGKHVHTAIGMGCGTCRQVETQEETTLVTLTAAREELCGMCHEKGAEQNLHTPLRLRSLRLCSRQAGQAAGWLRTGECTRAHQPRSWTLEAACQQAGLEAGTHPLFSLRLPSCQQ